MASRSAHTDIWIKRNRRLWSTAAQVGLDEEALRDVVESVTGKRSISGLSERHQVDVIRLLDGLERRAQAKRRRQKKRVDGSKGKDVTYRQIQEMWRLSEKLGWGRPALRAWVQRIWKVDREEWLTASQGSRAIEGLKAMVKRKVAAVATGRGATGVTVSETGPERGGAP